MTVIVQLELRHIDLLAATRPTHLKLHSRSRFARFVQQKSEVITGR